MFEREMMISGLLKQRNLLASLIEEIENRPAADPAVWLTRDDRARKIADNLRQLRRIKDSYFTYPDSDSQQ